MLPNHIENLILSHFKVVPNTQYRGAWCIKHPCGMIEPVRGSYNQVQRTLLSMDSADLKRALDRLSKVQSSLLAIQQQNSEYSVPWIQASKEQCVLYSVVFDLDEVRDYLLSKQR